MTHRSKQESRPWLIAHRGARDEAPENTCSAFERALTYPIDGIELDVHLSADGIPIIYHDTTLYRITGRRTRITTQTRAQLEALDWGRWYHPDFTGEPLSTLAKTLEVFGPRTRLLIEIKSSPSERKTGRIDQLTRKVIELLDAHSSTIPSDHIHILSFDDEALCLAHQLAPQWRYVLNLPSRKPEVVMKWSEAALSHLWAVDVRIKHLSNALVEWARSFNLRVYTYTCNKPNQVKKALKLGADGILTDRPGWLTGYLNG